MGCYGTVQQKSIETANNRENFFQDSNRSFEVVKLRSNSLPYTPSLSVSLTQPKDQYKPQFPTQKPPKHRHHCQSPRNHFGSLTLFFFPAMIHKKQALHTTRGLSIQFIEFFCRLFTAQQLRAVQKWRKFPHSRSLLSPKILVSMRLSDEIAGCDKAAVSSGVV